MSRCFYADGEDSSKEESIDKYEYIFEEYKRKCPTLNEALEEMFIGAGATEDKAKDLIKEITAQIDGFLTKEQLEEIKKKYPKTEEDEARIISSYTCELSKEEDSNYNIYRILNNNLVSQNRQQGVKKISKYLFILLKSLRNLKRFVPGLDTSLYRCINAKVNLTIDPFDKTKVPYIKGNVKTFWGFTSTSVNVLTTYNFLGKKENFKKGTIFELIGEIWGYDITLFNVCGEEEILLEPERKMLIASTLPEVNEIIRVQGHIQKTPLVLSKLLGNNLNNEDIITTPTTNSENSSRDKNNEENKNEIKEEKIDEITIKYKINEDNKNNVKIFGDLFVRNNKNNCEIICENKSYELTDIFNAENYSKSQNEQLLEIKLKGISKIIDMSHIFDDCYSLNSLPNISKLDTSSITNMSYIFSGCESLVYLPDISNWDTSSVTDISYMFNKCEKLRSLPDISKWNIKNVKDMSYMFNGCKSLTYPPEISTWDTFSVTNMSFMFNECEKLSTLVDISKWNTSSVTNMAYMFSGCNSLTNMPDISKWNTSSVNNMSYLFQNCKRLSSLPEISKWNTSNATEIEGMFSGCETLSALPDISKWNISNVTILKSLFNKCKKLASLPHISNWNTSSITDMSYIFCECESLFSFPISEWKTNSVTNMSYMFYNCKNFKSLNDIQKWNTSSVTDMSYMFYGCKNLESISSISSWDVQSVTNMEYMFYDCIKSLSSDNSLDNISKWNLSNDLNDNNMFSEGKNISSYKKKKEEERKKKEARIRKQREEEARIRRQREEEERRREREEEDRRRREREEEERRRSLSLIDRIVNGIKSFFGW